MIMNIRSKKGSYIMEAAIVLPVIIFVIITIILIVMFFYSQMTERSQMHIAMRREAGIATGRTIYMNDAQYNDQDAEIYIDKKLINSKVHGKKYLIMKHKGVLKNKGAFIVEGEYSAIDGPQYVRYCSFIKGIKE